MNKKIKVIIFILLGICLLFVSVNIFSGDDSIEEESENIAKNEIINEYTPLEEITEEQNRQTVVKLFYNDKNTGEIKSEERRIDSKNLLEEPYKYLVELLIQKPDNTVLESCIPEGTRVISANMKGNILELNLSKEFVENHKGTKEEEEKTIKSIVNTVTELNEVDGVKFLIDGKEDKAFKDEKINFKEVFKRK